MKRLISYDKVPQNSENKPLQIQAPLTGNAKNPPLNRPSKYNPPGACTWKIALKYRVKPEQKRQIYFQL